MSLAKLMIAVSLPLVRVILQGCGGEEEEEATTVAQNATTNIVTNCDVSSAGHCGTRNSCDHQCCRHWCRSHSLAVVEVLFDTSQWGMGAIYAEQLWQVGRDFSPRKMKKLRNPSASWTVWPRISRSSKILHLVPMRTGFATSGCLETPWHGGVFVDWQEVTLIATTSRRAVMWLQHWYLIKDHKGIVPRKEHFWHLLFGHVKDWAICQGQWRFSVFVLQLHELFQITSVRWV